MNIIEYLDIAAINPSLQATNKGDALVELTEALLLAEPDLSKDEVVRVLKEREQLGSTGIGDGVAIPHGKLKDIDKLLLAFGKSTKGVNFDSMDAQPAHLFFLLIAPEESVGVHLKMLARISKLLKNQDLRKRLLAASSSEEVYDIIATEEEKL